MSDSSLLSHPLFWALIGIIALLFFAFLVYLQYRFQQRLVSIHNELNQKISSLRESEERYRTVVDNTRDVVWKMDMSGRFTFISPSAQEMFGYSLDEIYEKNVSELFDAQTARTIAESLQKRQAGELGNKGVEIELELQRKNGSSLFADTQTTPIFDSSGKPVEIIGVTRDITQRKVAERALSESENLFRAIVDLSPMGIYMYELNSNGELLLMLANRASEEFTGIESEPLIGRTIEEAFPGLAESDLPDKYRRVAREGGRFTQANVPYRHDNRQQRYYDINVFQSGPNRIVVLFIEVTEKLAIEEQLRQTQKIEAIGNLAGGVAHDFNNLLACIMGYSEILIERLADNPEHRRLVEEIHSASERAAALVQRLLAFARKQQLEPKRIDLNRCIESMRTMLSHLVKSDHKLEIELCKGELAIMADLINLEQVLINLVINARDAMPIGGAIKINSQSVRFDSASNGMPPGEYAHLSIADEGIGLSPETKERIFEPFFTTKEVGQGTGLGLSTVYGIVKQCGGYIHVNSEEGKGAEFSLYFPKSIDDSEPS